MPIISKENERSLDGNPLRIEIELNDGTIITIEFFCTVCGHTRFWLREDRTEIYCAKCRTPNGRNISDMADIKGVTWAIPGK